MKPLVFWAQHQHWPTIHLEVGDITTYTCDAVVTGIRPDLLLSGGVNTAIHRAAGAQLAQAINQIGHCPLGQAVISQGYNLPAKYVIHTACPVYDAQKKDQSLQILGQCYLNSLNLALKSGVANLVFPALATGVFGFSHQLSAVLVARTMRNFLLEPARYNSSLKDIYLVIYHQNSIEPYEQSFKESFV